MYLKRRLDAPILDRVKVIAQAKRIRRLADKLLLLNKNKECPGIIIKSF